MAGKTDYTAQQKQLNEDIKHATFKPCYLIYGDEAYLRMQNRDRLRDAMMGEGDRMNLLKVSGEEATAEAIIEFADTMPFFADRRVIVVQDSGFFKHGEAELDAYLKEGLPETSHVIFVETAVDKRLSLYKTVTKLGFAVECGAQSEADLRKWIGSRILAGGKSIDPDAAEMMLAIVGTNMFNLYHETEKLMAYAGERKEITVQDVRDSVANWVSGEIFAMTDALSSRDRVRAMELYMNLLAMKEPPQRVLYMITRQIRILLLVKEMEERRKSSSEVAKEAGIPPFIVRKYSGWASRYTADELKEIMECCLKNEHAAKSGRLDYGIATELTIQDCTLSGK